MGIKKTTPLDILLSGTRSMMIYGEPKVGKSHLAGSFPNQVFIAVPTSEALTLAQVPAMSNTPVWGCSTWEDVKTAVDQACDLKVNESFDTITLDNLTFAYKMAFNHVLDNQRRPVVSEATWPNVNREVASILDRLLLTGHGKNVTLVAHNRVDRDEEGRITKVHPDFGENFSRTISGRVNAVFHLRQKGKDRELVVKAIGGIVAGSRYNLDISSMINPTPTDIINAIEDYKRKVTQQHA
jgi:hypothetical protein